MDIKGNLVFIGLPGSGKTTLGEFAARKLGRPLLDTDALIEDNTGERITDIFSRYGEEAFRSIERDIVQRVSAMNYTVIATGGGAWLDSENRGRLQRNGTVVYLYCEMEKLWDRLRKDSESRPLLREGFESLKRLYQERHQSYRAADYTLDTTGVTLEGQWDRLSQDLGLGLGAGAGLSVKRLSVPIPGRAYDIVLGNGIMPWIGGYLEQEYCTGDVIRPRILLITNPFVKALCGERISKALVHSGFNVCSFVVPEGEQHKTLDWARKAYSYIVQRGFDRGDVVLAVGGGVIGDLAGFVAATYMRGLSLVHVPTTLLAQVDSSIGGKTAVNLPEGKNLVGAFYQPDLVVSDLCMLRHLSEHQYRQGLAECVKYGILDGQGLFGLLEGDAGEILSRNMEKIRQIVEGCCGIKARIVASDEREKGTRTVLNLGHTIGHAVEAAAGYGILGHGDAVALGIRAETRISTWLGMMPEGTGERIERLLDGLGFPDKAEFPVSQAVKYLERDKKNNRGQIRIVLPRDIGRVEEITGVPPYLLEEAFAAIGGDKNG